MNEKPQDGITRPLDKIVMLPCPFCGEIPHLKCGKVKCVNIRCKVQPKIKAWFTTGYDKEAIEEWNERI